MWPREIAAPFASNDPDHVRRLILVDSDPPRRPNPDLDATLDAFDDRLKKDPRFSEAMATQRELETPNTPEEMAKTLQRMAPFYWHDDERFGNHLSICVPTLRCLARRRALQQCTGMFHGLSDRPPRNGRLCAFLVF
jgi:pimeloyl-ACP methyl ester carboxylesterase